MNHYKVITKEVLIRTIYVQADNPQLAAIKATVGPPEFVATKEDVYRIEEEEIPLEIVDVQSISDQEFYRSDFLHGNE